MQISSLVYTDHAVTRMSQRNLDVLDIDYVVEHGTRFIRAGAVHIFLAERNIPESERCYPQISRLVGTTVLIDSREKRIILTAYRNRESINKDRRKSKFKYRSANTGSSIANLPLAV